MTNKQLQSVINFIFNYDSNTSDEDIEKRFGVKGVSELSREAALSEYLRVHGIKLEAAVNYTATIQFGSAIMCAIQTVDPNLSVSGAVNGWGDSVLKEVSIQVTKNESEVTNGN